MSSHLYDEILKRIAYETSKSFNAVSETPNSLLNVERIIPRHRVQFKHHSALNHGSRGR
mgnify:CR=1 FL=1